MGQVRVSLPWAESRKVKEEIDLQILTLLGPKREEDLVKPPKAKGEKKEKKTETSAPNTQAEQAGKERSEGGGKNNINLVHRGKKDQYFT